MKLGCIALTVGLAAQSGLGEATTCRGATGNHFTVEEALDWCARDHGFNEGAVCGANALSSAGIAGAPRAAAGPILGNAWDRTNMMGASIKAAKAGQVEPAVNAAICCQIHNADAHACLVANRDAVYQWLRKR